MEVLIDSSFYILWPVIYIYLNLWCITYKWPLTFLPKVQNSATNKISIFSIFLDCVTIIYSSAMKTEGFLEYYNQANVYSVIQILNSLK